LRNIFAKTLFEVAKNDPRIVLLTGDLGFGVLDEFERELPKQFFNLGVTEQSIISIAAGMASEGYRPFVYSIANFPTFRAMEQIRNDISYMNLGVVIVALGAGFSYGTAGYSHYLIEDIAPMRAFENIEIFNPCTAREVEVATSILATSNLPGYLRLGRLEDTDPDTYDSKGGIGDFATKLASGKDGTILISGPLADLAFAARASLLESGQEVGIASIYNLSAIDLEDIMKHMCSPFVSLEEHRIAGGLGTILLEKANSAKSLILLERIGIKDFSHSLIGNQKYMRECYGLSVENICIAFDRLRDYP
jgi:transketolase